MKNIQWIRGELVEQENLKLAQTDPEVPRGAVQGSILFVRRANDYIVNKCFIHFAWR